MKFTLKGTLPYLLPVLLAACGGDNTSNPAQPNVQASSKKSSQTVAAEDHKAVVQRIYLGYFGRPADPAGLAYWAQQYSTAGMPTDLPSIRLAYANNPTVRAFIDIFGTSQESLDLYPGDNATFINAIYLNLFNRPADAAGKAYWVDLLDRNVFTRSNAALTIMDGALGTDRSIIDNKMLASATFTASLNTPEREAGYKGNAANAKVRTMLGQISANTDMNAFQATIDATIVQLSGETPGGGSNPAGQYIGFQYGYQEDTDPGYAVISASGGTPTSVIAVGHAELAGGASSASVTNYVVSNSRMHSQLLWKDQQLVRQDLISTGGVPALVQVSNLTKAQACDNYSNTWGNDISNPNNSWAFFRKAGSDGSCGTSDDTYVATRMNASASTTPQAVSQPVATRMQSNGALQGFLVRNGQSIQHVNADLTTPVTLFTLPGADLDNFEYENDMWHTWMFESGKSIYAWDLNVTTPGAPTLVKALGPTDTLIGYRSIDANEVFVAVRDTLGGTVQVLRYNVGNKSTTVVGSTPAGPTSSYTMELSASRVILRDSFTGVVKSMPRSGGAAVTIYTPTGQNPMFMAGMLQIVGERVWVGGLLLGSTATFMSDGTGLINFETGSYAGCVYRSSFYIGDNYCESMLINVAGSLGLYDGTTGALKLTYGNMLLPGNDATFSTSMMNAYSTFGQSNVITQSIVTDDTYKGHYYFLTTDKAGLQKLVLP